MTNKNVIKAISLAPFAIAFGFALMFLSYVLVPVMVIGSVASIIYVVILAIEMDKEKGD